MPEDPFASVPTPRGSRCAKRTALVLLVAVNVTAHSCLADSGLQTVRSSRRTSSRGALMISSGGKHTSDPDVQPLQGSPLLVSLSSIPARLHLLNPVLEQLFNQTRPADAIYLALPWWSTRESKFYDLPYFLLPEGTYGSRVRILRSSVDYGPATKFIPIIQEMLRLGLDDARIVVVDDDQLYPLQMLDAYDRWSQQDPNSAFTLRGHKMIEGPVDWSHLAFHNIIHSYELAALTCVDIITAVGSYMIRPRFFSPELWEALYIHEAHSDSSSRLKGAHNADDIWISGMLARQGISKFVIPGRMHPWDPEQPMSEYLDAMTIPPWTRPAEYVLTPALGGGSDDDNNELLEAFWDKWSCFGEMMTVPYCPRNEAGSLHRISPDLICLKPDGDILYI